MSRLEQPGRVTLSAVLYFCCSLVWIFFVCVSLTVVRELAVEFVSVQRKNLRQGDCRTIEGSTLSGTLENAAVTRDLIYFLSLHSGEVGRVFCHDVEFILEGWLLNDDQRF